LLLLLPDDLLVELHGRAEVIGIGSGDLVVQLMAAELPIALVEAASVLFVQLNGYIDGSRLARRAQPGAPVSRDSPT
jgi:hypothetical protein